MVRSSLRYLLHASDCAFYKGVSVKADSGGEEETDWYKYSKDDTLSAVAFA